MLFGLAEFGMFSTTTDLTRILFYSTYFNQVYCILRTLNFQTSKKYIEKTVALCSESVLGYHMIDRGHA